MVRWSLGCWMICAALTLSLAPAEAQQAGNIRGVVYDKDFDAPLAAAEITIVETGQKITASEDGNYSFGGLEPGKYTVLFSKNGYANFVKTDVVVTQGQLTELNASLSGEFTEMEEFIVQDVQIGGGTEAALLDLRLESPALMDSISADLMSQAGAGDAASALKLVSGATVQDGKYAVIRGLPDRYVSSQMNSVRLPTADVDKRAVELDQFPSEAIESIQVSKTFTPDQQGDASGGAVNVVLKGVPDKRIFKLSTQTSYNVQVTDFLTYKGGGVRQWAKDDGGRDVQEENIGGNWDGAVGVMYGDAPIDYKWSLAIGDKFDVFDNTRIGGWGSFFWQRDSSYVDDMIDDKYWVVDPGEPMTPQYTQGAPSNTDPENGDFKTSLFDVVQGSEEIKLGWLTVLGIEVADQELKWVNLYTRTAEDEATMAEDTRGKEYYFPGYNADDPTAIGNQNRDSAPYLRLETLTYTERVTRLSQFSGHHVIPIPEFGIDGFFTILQPEVDWYTAKSIAEMYQPDKRQFGSLWWPSYYYPGRPPYVSAYTTDETFYPFKPTANFTIGNLQRIYKEIIEESDQHAVDVKFPFEQWTGTEGYVKFGVFKDEVTREYNQDSYSNFNDSAANYEGAWEEFWSAYFPDEDHPITAAEIDVDYCGVQNISAWYWMADFPLTSFFKVIGGARYEETELSIVNIPEDDVNWFPEGAKGPIDMEPGDADVNYEQRDMLPAIGFELKPFKQLKLRGNYSETVARQTFKELTPIQQQEFLGADVFIGNPALRMSALKNYDLRLDYTPYEGGLISASWFSKDITDPIEYVQRLGSYPYTTPVNYPEGELSGYEFEIRQDIGRLWERLEGLNVRANATFIESEVTLPEDEAEEFADENILAPMPKRDMTQAPEYLYNVFLTYDLSAWNIDWLEGTELGAYYTVQGDTLIAGAGQSKGNYVPNVYAKEYGTLNLSVKKKFGDHFSVKLAAKNVTDSLIETVYRSEYIGEDVTKTSFHKGVEYSLGMTITF
ncbi:TonB-dependent receptor [Candidatus Sumerlaeota bacterium]|nr:TonB-dependent receptor [Candidatus Sumerlaeota bacterium]